MRESREAEIERARADVERVRADLKWAHGEHAALPADVRAMLDRLGCATDPGKGGAG